ncbi:MAG: hypothetical protein JNN01_27165 [Opitutaceae bacterium]|nr:hypothetical protein [Opitutaceae bacterium]
MICLVLASRAGAQFTWSAAPSPTTETLWGVTYGGGRFVAVGERGVILTSNDGQTWIRQESGTTVWLLHVAYGSGQFIAVGDRETFLVSVDGVHWQRAKSVTGTLAPHRVNAVLARGESFYAFGENGSTYGSSRPLESWHGEARTQNTGQWWRGVCLGLDRIVLAGSKGIEVNEVDRSPDGLRNLEGVAFADRRFVVVGAGGRTAVSRDGDHWDAGDSGLGTTLRGVTAFNHQFVAVGDGGKVVISADGRGWTRRESRTERGLRAVAASGARVVAVGEAGSIVTAPSEPIPPMMLRAMEDVIEEEGGSAYLQVEATGSDPLSYEWTRNGQPVATTNRPILDLPRLELSQAGDYAVTVHNPYGTATSSPVKVTVFPVGEPGLIDTRFNADLEVEQGPNLLLPLEDGRLLVAGGRPGELVRLREDGSRDTEFQRVQVTAEPSSGVAGQILVVMNQPDGKVLVGGRFRAVNGSPGGPLVRVLTDGSLDPSFRAANEIADGDGVCALVVLSDGRIVVANGSVRLRRLHGDGSLDSTFVSAVVPRVDAPHTLGFRVLSARPDGGLVAGGVMDGSGLEVGPVLLRADGTVERMVQTDLGESWRETGTIPAGGYWSPYTCEALRVLPDGRIMAMGTRWFVALRTSDRMYFQHCSRYLPNGEPDPTYLAESPVANGRLLARRWSQVWLAPDGRTLSASGPMIRMRADGSRDTAIVGVLASGAVTSLIADMKGRILVGSDHPPLNRNSRRALNRLNEVAYEGRNAPSGLLITAEPDFADGVTPVTFHVSVKGSGPLWEMQPTGFVPFRPSQSLPVGIGGARVHLVNTLGWVEGTISLEDRRPYPPPQILEQSTEVGSQSGRDLTLRLRANPGNPWGSTVIVSWRRDGVWLGYTYGDLFIAGIAPDQAGTYTATVYDAKGGVSEGAPIRVTVDLVSRLVNLSARAWVGPGRLQSAGEQGLFAGWVVPGPGKRRLLIRGIGPGLRSYGVAQPLTGVQLAVMNSSGGTVAYGERWDQNPLSATAAGLADFAAVGAFPLAAGSKDAALLVELDPGSYTATLNGVFDFPNQRPGVGVGLIEVYEFDRQSERLVNLSARVTVGVGSEPAIPGFVVSGAVPKRLLVRAVGPSLGAFGVTSFLPDPRFEVRSAAGELKAANDNWSEQEQPAAVRQATATTGAFALAEGSRDAACVVSLLPGAYTVVVTGVPGTEGIALVEVYELP